MKKRVNLPIPAMRALRRLGEDINHARRRRRVTARLMAERAGISRTTMGKIEKGDPTASMGAYASVLFVLGMTDRLEDMADATHDLTGRRLEEESLPRRVRIPKAANRRDDDE